MNELNKIEEFIIEQLEKADSEYLIEKIRVYALGKKGKITQIMRSLSGMSIDERKSFGKEINNLKSKISELINAKRLLIQSVDLEKKLKSESLDLTLPINLESNGNIHPVSQVFQEVSLIFSDMGFDIAEGPDIEDDWHNFTALNIPPEHPARQMHDTFYIKKENDFDSETAEVLRTHTSPVQVRTMLQTKPPINIIVPGRTYRSDSDQTHTPMFHQVEGLVIDEKSHMGHLKGCLVEFVKKFFNIEKINYRFRPSYFPFTEPSAEMDIGCVREGNKIELGGDKNWLEILGCGMVNPVVLENCGVDSRKYQGFAFGMGIDRIAMLKYGMSDLRSFFDSDLRWLKHFGFSQFDFPPDSRRRSF
ncbi:MAG: Phenylalanine--tRNA ligase alpha subunit [Alphaproteobacteria bacterium MarineAlpha2_Bin1]|nr:MAG: Phenylalanine--tRNA ligase alpha subunit [Alphaproteobacteria bacterium MarineAlpha2_Bin1]|tara:strand:+ start:857 stop:1942 length:1086 start_codon:yes stop_codon:yes gene_type:complete